MSDSPTPGEAPKIIVDEDWKSKVEAEKEALKQGAPPAEEDKSLGTAPSHSETPSAEQLPAATFEVLVSMLATQASIELGQGAEPQAEHAKEHFAIGKHFIDLLGVVEEKTKGNLSPDEAKMIDAVLHDLRMAYIRLKP